MIVELNEILASYLPRLHGVHNNMINKAKGKLATAAAFVTPPRDAWAGVGGRDSVGAYGGAPAADSSLGSATSLGSSFGSSYGDKAPAADTFFPPTPPTPLVTKAPQTPPRTPVITMSTQPPGPNPEPLFAVSGWGDVSSEAFAACSDEFARMGPVGGKLSGEQLRDALVASGLSKEQLWKIWDLADIDADGHLDVYEFAIIKHLIRAAQEDPQVELPTELPAQLMPPTKALL
jgi:hypothetical protein